MSQINTRCRIFRGIFYLKTDLIYMLIYICAQSLVNDKVDTYFSNISHIDETGIVTTDGKHKKYDAIGM